MKAAPTARQPAKDRSHHDRRGERPAPERRSGEGSESALANLRSIELDRRKTRIPVDDGGGD